MKTFSIFCASLALTLGGLVGEVKAQNLSGTWVSSDGAEYKITHTGNQIRSSFWGGPRLPNLVGSNTMSGGPTTFTGTWLGEDGPAKGSGSIVYFVANANEFTSVTQGFITTGDSRTPITVTVRWPRKIATPEPEPTPGPPPEVPSPRGPF